MKQKLATFIMPLLLGAWGCASDGKTSFGDDPASGSGGQPSGTGGAGGAAGGAPPAFVAGPVTYGEFGYLPSTMAQSDAQSAFEAWRAGYVEDCGASGMRVIGSKPEQTLAEGIGFGALLSVAWDDRATFDGLWTYYQTASAAADQKRGESHGLMGWLVSDACAVSDIEPGSSAGAALDMSMALLQAACVWGDASYFDAAFRLVGSVQQYMTTETASGMLLLPDDAADAVCMNPSYFSPGYYRVFGRAFPDQAEFWNRLADDTYTFLDQASNPTTGLASDWVATGSSVCDSATDFVGYDGMRTLWRTQTDYAWFGSPAAKSWLDRVTNWAQADVGVEQLPNLHEGFSKDGSDLLGETGKGNSAFVGGFAVAAMATDQTIADEFNSVFLAVPPENDQGYYQATARALYMLLSVNKLSSGCFAAP